MHVTRVSVVCLLLTAAVLTQTASAQQTAAGQPILAPDVGRVAVDDVNGTLPLWGWDGAYLMFRKDIGSGVGYQDGYSTFGLFAPVMTGDNSLVFGNGRLFVTDNGDFGGNLGGAWRVYAPNIDRVFGASVWYDRDTSYYGNGYNQFTFGLESMGRYLDFRANAYAPTGTKQNFLNVRSLSTIPTFTGNGVFFAGSAVFEEAMPGADFEIGAPFPGLPFMRAYGGGYYYDSDHHQNPAGVRGRLDARLNNALSLQFAATKDQVYGTTLTMAVDIRLTGRAPSPAWMPLAPRDRMYLPIDRNYRVATRTYVDDYSVAGVNPTTGLPYNIVYVNDTNAAPGTGTFENPYQAMPATAAGADVVFVYTGISSAGNPYGPITLANNQQLLGEGIPHLISLTVPFFNTTTVVPNVPMPGNTTGPLPTLSNPAGNAVTLANNNVVSGFNIVNTSGFGIFGSGANGFNINNVNIDNSGGGIFINNASGTGSLASLNLTNNTAGGVIIDTGTSALTLTADDITASGGLVGVSLAADNAALTLSADNLRTTGNITGFALAAGGGNLLTAGITNSLFSGNFGDGVNVQAIGGNFDLGFADINSSNNAGNGFNVLADGASNSFLTLLRTNANDNGADGLHMVVTNSSLLNATVTDNSLVRNLGDGIDATVSVTSTLNLPVDPTAITDNVQNGFRFNVTGNSVLNAPFTDDDLSRSGANAILGTIDNSLVNLQLLNTPADEFGQNGLFVTANAGSVFNATVTNGSLDHAVAAGASGNAVRLILDASTANLALTDTTALNAGSDGLFINATGGSTVTTTVTNGSFANAGTATAGNGLNVNLNNSDGTLTLTNTAATGAGGSGVRANVTNGGTLTATLTGNLASGAGSLASNNANALRVLVSDPGSAATFTLTGINGNLSGQEGIFANLANGGQFTLNSTGNTFDNSGADGLFVTAASNALFNGTFTNNSFSNNGLNGMRIVADGGAASATLTDTTVNTNAASGLVFAATNDGLFSGSVTRGSIASNGGSGVIGTVAGTNSAAGLTFNQTSVTLNGQRGGLFNVQAGGSFGLQVTDGTFAQNGLSNLEFVVDGVGTDALSSTVIATLTNTSLNQSTAADGLRYALTNGGQFGVLATDTTISSNAGRGIFGTGAGAGGSAVLQIDNTRILSNGAQGISVSAASGSDLTLSILDFSEIVNNVGAGVLFNADGAGTVTSMLLTSGSSVTANGLTTAADGIQVNLSNGAAFSGQFSGVVTGNGDEGLEINSSGAATTISNLVIDGRFEINGGNGVNVNLTNTTLAALTVANGTFDQNTGDGFDLVATSSALGTVSFNNDSMAANGDDGLFISLLGSSVADLEIFDNTDLLNSTGGIIRRQGLQNNTNNGLNLNLGLDGVGAGSTITTANIFNNLFDDRPTAAGFGNGGDAIHLTSDGGNIADLDIFGNTIGDAGGAGIQAILTNSTLLAQADFNTRIFANSITNNGALGGVVIDAGDTGFAPGNPMSIVIGSADASLGNLIDNNTGFGVGVTVRDRSVAELQILNNVITNSTNDGINIALNGSNTSASAAATLQNSQIDGNQIGDTATSGNLGNGGVGIAVTQTQFTRINNLLIGNMDATLGNGNLIRGNNGTGITFNRTDNGIIDLVRIQDNSIDNNDAGIAIIGGESGGVTDVLDFNIVQNDIINNTAGGNAAFGVSVTARLDARLQVDMVDNLIDSNSGHGIMIDETVDFSSNTRLISGTWLKNTITNSGRNGVNLQAVHNITIGANGLDTDGRSFGNLISDNTGNGINVSRNVAAPGSSSVGTLNVINNLIQNNVIGVNLTEPGVINLTNNQILASTGDGVVLTANQGEIRAGTIVFGANVTNATNVQNLLTMTGNTIAGSGGDGIQLVATQAIVDTIDPVTLLSNAVRMNVVMSNNIVNNNTGRGLNLFNLGNATSDVRISGTGLNTASFSGNTQQGIYAVNSADVTQSTASNTTTMAATGAPTNSPNLIFVVDRVTINSNGDGTVIGDPAISPISPTQPPTGTGLVLRVGTSDVNGGDYAAAGGGGVRARIDNIQSFFNHGADVYIDSFVSTTSAAPALGAVRDPLARLDLQFRNNQGDELDVTNVGAFYNNADAFKSPGNNAPFSATTRNRNAQRILGDWVNFSSGAVIIPPAATVATFSANNTGGKAFSGINNGYSASSQNIQARFTSGPLSIPSQQSRRITAYTAGAPAAFTVAPGYTVPPLIGNTFELDAIGLPGLGGSTFRVDFVASLSNNFASTLAQNGFLGTAPLGNTVDEALWPFAWDVAPLPPLISP